MKLIHRITAPNILRLPAPPGPFGYGLIGPMVMRDGRCDSYEYAPIGLHALIRLWRTRYDWWELLVWLGFWNIEEGDYYHNGHWRWDFRRSRREMEGPYGPMRLWPMGPPYGMGWAARLYRACRRSLALVRSAA